MTQEERQKAINANLNEARDGLTTALEGIDAAIAMSEPDDPPAPEPTEPNPPEPLPPVEALPPVDPEPVEPIPQPEPKPPAPPELPTNAALFKAASGKNLQPMSGKIPSMVTEIAAHRVRAKHWPDPERVMSAQAMGEESGLPEQLPAVSMKGMRHVQSYAHEIFLETAVTKNYKLVYKLADLFLTMKSYLADKSLPIPTTKVYAKMYTSAVARAKAILKKTNPNVTDEEAAAWADQPGLLRLLYYTDGSGTPDTFGFSDFHDLERSLTAGTLAESAWFFKANSWLGEGRNSKAFDFLMEFITEHFEPRNIRLAKLYHGANAKPWYIVKTLLHASIAFASYYTRMYQITGEKYWSDCADEIWAAIKKEIYRFDLPDGRRGWAHPHFVNPIVKERTGGHGGDTWHNTVYLAETAPRVLIDALMGGGGFELSDTEELANTLYHTLFKWGWDGQKADWRIAGDMGGGGSALPKAQRKGVLASGKMIDAPYYIGGLNKQKEEDWDSFITVQRGMTLIGAAYTDIPDYEAKLQHLKSTSTAERRGMHLPLMLFEAKRQGRLPGRS